MDPDFAELLPPPAAFVCPISQEIMTDPVAAADGSVYERSSIEAWFKNTKCGKRSPVTNLPLPTTTVAAVLPLRRAIEEYLQHRPELVRNRLDHLALQEAVCVLVQERDAKWALKESQEERAAKTQLDLMARLSRLQERLTEVEAVMEMMAKIELEEPATLPGEAKGGLASSPTVAGGPGDSMQTAAGSLPAAGKGVPSSPKPQATPSKSPAAPSSPVTGQPGTFVSGAPQSVTGPLQYPVPPPPSPFPGFGSSDEVPQQPLSKAALKRQKRKAAGSLPMWGASCACVDCGKPARWPAPQPEGSSDSPQATSSTQPPGQTNAPGKDGAPSKDGSVILEANAAAQAPPAAAAGASKPRLAETTEGLQVPAVKLEAAPETSQRDSKMRAELESTKLALAKVPGQSEHVRSLTTTGGEGQAIQVSAKSSLPAREAEHQFEAVQRMLGAQPSSPIDPLVLGARMGLDPREVKQALQSETVMQTFRNIGPEFSTFQAQFGDPEHFRMENIGAMVGKLGQLYSNKKVPGQKRGRATFTPELFQELVREAVQDGSHPSQSTKPLRLQASP